MPGPVKRAGKYYCPICGAPVSVSSVRYSQIVDGVYESGRMVVETELRCDRCGWSYWVKES